MWDYLLIVLHLIGTEATIGAQMQYWNLEQVSYVILLAREFAININITKLFVGISMLKILVSYGLHC